MTVFTYDNGKRTGACRDFLLSSGKLGGHKMLTILPIPTTRDGIHITGSDKTLDTLVGAAGAGDIYLGYGLPDRIAKGLLAVGAVVVDALADEEFLVGNARLTAYATLAKILSLGISPEGMSVGVVGYGRIGRVLVRLLLAVGADVRVYSTREATVLCLSRSGVDATLVRRGDPLPVHDLLINTAPDAIFDTALSRRDVLTSTAPDRIFDTGSPLPSGMEIFELASGDNFGGIPITRLPALPERFYPEAAGRLYGGALLRGMGV